MSEGRHDVTVELWTAPPGTLGDSKSITDANWREKMACIAVSTQMALTMTPDANEKRGAAVKGKL
jgi:hypothetical protein